MTIENPPAFVLDSFAVLAHFQDEPGGEKVLELFTKAVQGEVLLAMSLVNVGEIAYLADAFAASLAQELKATLVTGDSEFKRLKNNPTLLWLE